MQGIKIDDDTYISITKNKRKDFKSFKEYWNNKYTVQFFEIKVHGKTKQKAINKLVKQLCLDSKRLDKIKEYASECNKEHSKILKIYDKETDLWLDTTIDKLKKDDKIMILEIVIDSKRRRSHILSNKPYKKDNEWVIPTLE